jgi:hypothetical protein
MRKVFKAAMGHGVNVKLEVLANDTPIKAGGSYIADSDSKGRLLRPDWSASFNENSRWHKSMLEFARKKAPVFHPTMTESMINAKTDDEIMERLENVFKNISDNYRRAQRNKAKTKGGEDAGENQEEGEHEKRAKELNRRGTRKVRVGIFVQFFVCVDQATDRNVTSDLQRSKRLMARFLLTTGGFSKLRTRAVTSPMTLTSLILELTSSPVMKSQFQLQGSLGSPAHRCTAITR